MTNFLRHRGLIHGLDKFGNPIDEATRRRFQNYSKPKQLPAQSSSGGGSDEDQPAKPATPSTAPQIPLQKCRSKGLLDESTM